MELACETMKERVTEVVRKILKCRAEKWDKVVKMGAMVPLYKKGDKNDSNNCRRVCLQSMCSLVLGKEIEKRLGMWRERMK